MMARVATLLATGGVLAACAGGGRLQTTITNETTDAPAANVVVDTTRRFQTWMMWSSLTRRWDAPHMYYGPEQGAPLERIPVADQQAILDLLYRDIGLNGVEVPLVRGSLDPSHSAPAWRSHEHQNDDDDPFSLDATAFAFDYWPPHLDVIKDAFARIRARGDVPVFGLRVGNVPDWLATLHDSDLRAEEYAEWVTALVLYFRDEHELVVDYISVNNEPEGNGVEAGELAARAVALDARLRALALPAQLAAPETVTPDDAQTLGYLEALEAAGIADSLMLVNYHCYDEDASVGIDAPLAPRLVLRDFAADHGAATFFSEQSSDVKANRRTFWNDTPEQALAWANDLMRELTVTNMAAYAHMWNFWTNNNPNFGTDPFVVVKVGPAPDYTYEGYYEPEYTSVLGTFIGAIRPGMVRVDATTNLPDVAVVAFVDDASQTLAVVVVNNGTSAQTLVLPNGAKATVPAKSVAALTTVSP